MPDNPFQPFMFPLTEEMRQHLMSVQMSRETEQRDAARFFDELTLDQLVVFRRFMSTFANVENVTDMARHYEGFCTGIIKYKFEACVDCGQKHDEFDISALVETHHVEVPVTKVEPDLEEKTLPATQRDYSRRKFGYPLEAPPNERDYGYSQRERDRMARLEIEDQRNEMTGELQGYACVNCGLLYSSIDDRSLKDDCHGCAEKSKWG